MATVRRNQAKSANAGDCEQSGELPREVAVRKPPMTPAEKELRKVKRSLIELSDDVLRFLSMLDQAMKMPNTDARGKRIAMLANCLDMTNDRVRYFTLGVDYRDDKKKPLRRTREKKIVKPSPELMQALEHLMNRGPTT